MKTAVHNDLPKKARRVIQVGLSLLRDRGAVILLHWVRGTLSCILISKSCLYLRLQPLCRFSCCTLATNWWGEAVSSLKSRILQKRSPTKIWRSSRKGKTLDIFAFYPHALFCNDSVECRIPRLFSNLLYAGIASETSGSSQSVLHCSCHWGKDLAKIQ